MIKSLFTKFKIKLIDIIEYYSIYIQKKSYSDYYAKRMNRIVKNNPKWGLNLNKKFQLDFLIQQGLSKSSTFLDYGCGAVSAGIHFIEYLDQSKYFGVDISSMAIHEAKRRIENKNLTVNKPTILLIDTNSKDFFDNLKFNYIWSQSVFTHLPPKEAKEIFLLLSNKLAPKGSFYFNFCNNKNNKIEQKNFKDWYYPTSFFYNLAKEFNLNIKIIEDWKHPEDYQNVDTLLMIKHN